MPATLTRATPARLLTRPIAPCEMLPAGVAGLVEIAGRVYTLEIDAELPESGEPVVYGYRLTSTDSYRSYEIDAETLECNCPDMTYRGRPCKHSRNVADLLARGEI